MVLEELGAGEELSQRDGEGDISLGRRLRGGLRGGL